MGKFSERSTETELMDDLSLDQTQLKKVLLDIDRANTFLNGNNLTVQSLHSLIYSKNKESYTILDMGCGNGSMLRTIVLWSRKHNFKLKCIGVDLNEKSLDIARQQSLNFPEIEYLKQDILKLQPDELQCDVLLCTLTMHHFTNEQIPQFLTQFSKLSRIGFIINDLQRSAMAYQLFKLFSTIFIRTNIAKQDGLTSIKSGFLKNELQAFATKLPKMKHAIAQKWAFRYVWVAEH
ncbi:methyltransferase domain-containing protein [Zobellia amurskyensis]|uniref:Methyltransferase domain-containing protein n=1 Tax=Zobellia amurskyensis TaxID=248905 RepID=A0A7X2ZTQ7_9FLAO|nr:methyltransferase domain-containing protein [Zobellia amurskyensis]MUH36221.1 methyltransferase domain-containing protein [Zobellia amurskyensis]